MENQGGRSGGSTKVKGTRSPNGGLAGDWQIALDIY